MVLGVHGTCDGWQHPAGTSAAEASLGAAPEAMSAQAHVKHSAFHKQGMLS